MNLLSVVPETVELETIGCPLCEGAQSNHVLTGPDRLHDLPGLFSVVECTSCGLKRTSPRPNAATIGFYYPDDYGPYKGTIVADAAAKPTDLKARFVSLAKQFFDTKAAALPNMPAKGRMLEIGCASGSFLHTMSQKGWQVEGIEFSDAAANSARALGYHVDTGAVETVEKPHAGFDLIVGWMVIEHLHDPISSLQKMAKWIKPGGKLSISVPNAGSIEFKVFEERWYALQLPTHLFHYDVKTITRILDNSGWQVIKIHHHRTVANLIASVGYLLRDKGFPGIGNILVDFPERGGRLGALLLFPIAYAMAMLGQTGRMTVWAELKQS